MDCAKTVSIYARNGKWWDMQGCDTLDSIVVYQFDVIQGSFRE